MNQHDTLTLREALRSIQYEAASLADAQVIALQALNATYPARAALSATQPAQAAQSEPAEHWHRLYLEKCQQYNDRVAQLGGVIEALDAEAAQGAPVPSDQSRWCAYVGGMVAHWVKSAPDAHARLGDDKFEAAIAGIIERRLWALRRDQAPAQPAAGADVLDAVRYRMVRRGQHWSVINGIGDTLRGDDLDAAIDAQL